jgi:hypothetical protein
VVNKLFNDSVLFVIVPKIAPILAALSWYSRKRWVTWVVFFFILPVCVYFTRFYGVSLLPLVFHYIGAKAYREGERQLAIGCFIAFVAVWLVWVWWWSALRVPDFDVRPL